ncbi:MAG: helix-turn-helix domain-containing protein [Haloferacaceae archaeon]
MALYEATFRVRHECPYREISERHPDLTIREWFMRDCQVLELVADAPTETLREDLRTLGTVLHESATDDGLHAVMRSCRCSLDDSIVARFETHDCLYQPPTVYRRGWEHYTVVAFEEADVRALLRDLDDERDVEVTAKTTIEERPVGENLLTPAERLFDGLTDRQVAALRLALDNGYYEQPRGASVATLAERTDVARSTFEEHLRKAENKLLTNAGQFVRPLTASRGTDPLVERSPPADD